MSKTITRLVRIALAKRDHRRAAQAVRTYNRLASFDDWNAYTAIRLEQAERVAAHRLATMLEAC